MNEKKWLNKKRVGKEKDDSGREANVEIKGGGKKEEGKGLKSRYLLELWYFLVPYTVADWQSGILSKY